MEFVLSLVQNPRVFFERLKLNPVQWAVPCLLLFLLWLLSSFIPLLVGELPQKDLLASLIFNGFALLILLVCGLLLAGGARILEVLGFSVLPLLTAMSLIGGLWFFGDLARGLGSLLTLLALGLAFRSVLIGLTVMTQNPAMAWRTVLLAPLLTFGFMAVPFGLLVRWLGLA